MITMEGVLYPAVVMGILGVAFGALLGFASIKFFVAVDARVSEIRELLPGANCGGCGYPGCDGYAVGIVEEGVKTNLCVAGGSSLAEGIAAIMGVDSESSVPMRAYLKCAGSPEFSARNAIYVGIEDCRSAAVVPGGSPNACSFGCMGLGTCVKVCVFGAMTIKDGLVVIDPDKCVGCGVCVDACPKSVLALAPKGADVQVACNSLWRGPDVKKVCKVGCIGCGLCARTCPEGAIVVENNLARIDGTKCTNCGKCTEKCPTKSIGYIVPKAAFRESA